MSVDEVEDVIKEAFVGLKNHFTSLMGFSSCAAVARYRAKGYSETYLREM